MTLKEWVKNLVVIGLAALLLVLGFFRFPGYWLLVGVAMLGYLAVVWALKLNRVLAGMMLFFIAVAFWEFQWKPQYRPLYEDGIAFYQRGDYLQALDRMEAAYNIAPNAMDVIMMMGWTNLKLKRFEEARFYFDRAIKIDPRTTDEAQMGAAFVALETGKGTLDIKLLNKILGKRRADPNVRILVAGALVQEGRNLEAATIYRDLLQDKSYSHASQVALDEMFGLKGFQDPVPQGLPPISRPAQTQVRHRAAEGAMWQLASKGWEKMYVNGVDLGPGAPGYYPGAPPTDAETYANWLREVVQVNANVVRAYTLLPPAFYRAFRHHMDAGGKLLLYQQIWVGEPPHKDLYDPQFVEATKAEIRYVIDSLHGQGNVPPKRARGSGVYTLDVSSQVGAILLGRELESSTAITTNVINAGKNKYDGKYVSVTRANATEVWFAEMLDYLIGYESDTYNWQHPVAIVNWPPLDPLTHPTESSNLEEVKARIRRGENLALPGKVLDDDDSVSIDEAKFRNTSNFFAGMFATYHVYPYYPDFLILDPKYLKARDSEGLNPMFGYLQELKAHIPFPLVISEFGVPSSMGISHFHPYGWHHGGHSEAAQGQVLARLAKGIREAGCAGGIVFELLDEWYKHNWLTVDFENPLERANLWLNDMDPEKRYGLVGFHTSKWKLFSGDDEAWGREPKLYSGGPASTLGDGYDADRTIRSVQAAADEGYLYLRIDVGCLDCTPGKRDGKTHFDKAAYAIAINTLPEHSGIKQLPFGDLTVLPGANFLLYLGEPPLSRLLIAANYNPYQIKAAGPGQTELSYRRDFTTSLEQKGSFVELVVETNRRRYGREGTAYPGQRYSRSVLRYGNGNPDAPDYDSLAEWYADIKRNMVLVRISWGKLLLTDPSTRQVFFGIDNALSVRTISSPGLALSVFSLKPKGALDDLRAMSVAVALPTVVQGMITAPQRITWKPWESVNPEPYRKKSYYALQKAYLEEQRGQAVASNVGTSVPARRGGGQPGRSPR